MPTTPTRQIITVSHILAVTRSVNTMVHFENREGDDMLTLTTDDIEERPGTKWWTRSRYATVLSVAGCLLTVVTTVSVYLTSLQDKGECRFEGGC